MKKQALTGKQLDIWNVLTNLKDGDRIVGRDLMAAAGITDERAFFGVIENLRLAGYQIGASKELHNPGYYQKRTDKDAWDYHFKTVLSLENDIEKVTRNTESFFKEKYGPSYDFIKEKNKEELDRHA